MTNKFLIIDSHPVFTVKLEGFIKGLGFSDITCAGTAKEGLTLFKEHPYNIVLVSAVLSDDIEPFGLCEEIKKLSKNTKVIVQTGLFTPDHHVNAFYKAGVDHVIPRKEKDLKPLEYLFSVSLK